MRRLPIALLMLAGCQTFGEGDIEVQLGSGGVAMEGLSTVDGWTLDFSKYVVSLTDLTVASDKKTGAKSTAWYVVDVAADEPMIERLESLAPIRWDAVSFSTAPPEPDGFIKTFEVDDATVEQMTTGGYAWWIEGMATKGDQQVSFSWALANPARFRRCVNGKDNQRGIEVANRDVVSMEITVHVEHLLFESLASENARLRFDAAAAMADADGVIPFAALANQNLSDLRDADGNPLTDVDGPVLYEVGDTVLPANTLGQYILASTRTGLHLGGDGRCTVTTAP